MSVICTVPLDSPHSGASAFWNTVQPVGSTLAQTDGQVLSCQPDGTFQLRPKGTAGAYELVALNGNVAVYNPAGTPFAFMFLSSVPNQ